LVNLPFSKRGRRNIVVDGARAVAIAVDRFFFSVFFVAGTLLFPLSTDQLIF
jgi:hypothetical protein